MERVNWATVPEVVRLYFLPKHLEFHALALVQLFVGLHEQTQLMNRRVRVKKSQLTEGRVEASPEEDVKDGKDLESTGIVLDILLGSI